MTSHRRAARRDQIAEVLLRRERNREQVAEAIFRSFRLNPPPPKYTEALKKPIAALEFRSADYLMDALAVKFLHLFLHFGINPSASTAWQRLAIKLALHHVPGMRVSQSSARPGPIKKWTLDRQRQLIGDVERLRAKSKTPISDAKAINILTSKAPWKSFTPQSLRTRYAEAKKTDRHMRAVKRVLMAGIGERPMGTLYSARNQSQPDFVQPTTQKAT
jgi:hypothetical protein